MTRSAFYNPLKAFEPRCLLKVEKQDGVYQSLKRQHEDELTVTSTVTPSSLLSSITTMSNSIPTEQPDRKMMEQPVRFRIIDLAQRCPPEEKFNSRAKRPGVEEDDNNGSAMALPNVSYKRISPDSFLPIVQQACIADPQQEQQRNEMLAQRRGKRVSLKRAISLLQTGSDAVQQAQHEQAIPALEEAAELLEFLRKSTARARCLDLLGQACSNSARWNESIAYLFEAFMIREAELGRMHVDTVDTLKHLGEVFLCSGNVRQARSCFAEVFWIQRAIFGTEHCGVAAAAHDLANAYDAADDLLQAELYYRTALEIYHSSGVHDDSPTIQGLLSDLRRVQST